MKIDWIKISNVFSFKYHENIDQGPTIVFDKNLNILIGPNGSGKSNFLEIINQVFRKFFFRDCPLSLEKTIELQSLSGNDRTNQLNNITLQKNHNFQKNNNFKEKPFEIKIQIKFSPKDRENFQFIFQHRDKIVGMLKEYYEIGTSFQISTITEQDLTNLENLEFSISESIDPRQNRRQLKISQSLTEIEQFVYDYLVWFEFIQNIILIANEKLSMDWEPLKNTFALIGSSREYQQFDKNFTVESKGERYQNLKNKLAEESTIKIESGEPSALTYVKLKLAFEYTRIINEMARGGISNQDANAEEVLKDSPLFKQINTFLKDSIDLELRVKKVSDFSLDYDFSFVDKNGIEIQIGELSSGQRGIIHFIFSIFGYDLENGLMIIDEPELHIHPQMQERYIEIMKNAMESQNIQFIVATHSPVFVNETTVDGVHRFHLENGYTQVVKPTISTQQKHLVKILDYTNSSKIFFSNKVILVEGITDEYFFKHFLGDYKVVQELQDKRKNISDIEILNLEGKTNYPFVKNFLNEFRIKSYFIGDLDNIFTLPNPILGPNLKLRFGGGNTTNKQIIQNIKANQQTEWSQIRVEIFLRYFYNVFLLREGELEDYIGRSQGKLENVIIFCRDHFSNWKNTNTNYLQEFNFIFTNILNDH
ncbi:MAG: AAA family ATPase [Thaumarchaeota archaeon]|nr:AAA family ATPase [Nitrososphaerota archaeon]